MGNEEDEKDGNDNVYAVRWEGNVGGEGVLKVGGSAAKCLGKFPRTFEARRKAALSLFVRLA